MAASTDPFDRDPALLQQALLAVVPLVVTLIAANIRGDWSATGLAVAALPGLIAALLIAWARLAQTRRLQRWLHSILESETRRYAHSEFIWDPSFKPLIRPIRRLATSATELDARTAELEALIDSLIAAIPDPILLVDSNEQVERLNPAARSALSVEGDSVPLVAVCRDPGLISALRDAQRANNSSSLSVQVGIDPVLDYSAMIQPVRFRPGKRGVLITMRERTEELLIERMRSDFIADASHEMRTPMTTILVAIETMRGPARDDPDASELFLEDMAEAGKRMMRLLDDLLSLSKIELDAVRAPMDDVSMSDIACSVAFDLEELAERRDMIIDVVGDTSSGALVVPGDTGQLRQVAANLVENAIKYGNTSSDVKIELEKLKTGPDHAGPLTGRPCIRFTVVDQGDGIEPAHIPRLTERFYRVDKARSRDLGGTGLGLAIVKHILRRHHGHLDIRSEVGIGSRFSCYLPQKQKTAS